ncbi:MAG: hypothetical protein HY321_18945 [Armatimonadetes bacterium]|nr:hypothetical protein [Armatimonadota bacterium]
MPDKKIACLGGGSGYFARALGDLAITAGLAGSEVVLYDIDREKAEVMGRHGARLAGLSGTGLRVRVADGLADALDGADFAITSIGGSGKSVGSVYGTGIHRQDVVIPAKYGVYQVVGDTGGPAGMMMGLRSIPIYLNICREMEKRCPDAVLFNHSNPMAVLCRAMVKYSGINVIGICHGVQEGIEPLAELLGVPPEELEVVWIGTNHYHWFTRVRHRGKDMYPEVWRRIAKRGPARGALLSQKLSEIYGHHIAYQHDSHILEFYPYLSRLPSWESIPYGFASPRYAEWGTDKGEAGPPVSEAEARALRQAQLQEIADGLAKQDLPAKASSPLTGEGLGSLIEAIAVGRRQLHIVNIPNRGVVPNLPEHALLEVEAVTDSCGVRGVYAGEAPLSLLGILQKRIAWQELVVEAGVKGDRNLALQALLLDEMAVLPEQAEAMLDELLAASRSLLPQFG